MSKLAYYIIYSLIIIISSAAMRFDFFPVWSALVWCVSLFLLCLKLFKK